MRQKDEQNKDIGIRVSKHTIIKTLVYINEMPKEAFNFKYFFCKMYVSALLERDFFTWPRQAGQSVYKDMGHCTECHTPFHCPAL